MRLKVLIASVAMSGMRTKGEGACAFVDDL